LMHMIHNTATVIDRVATNKKHIMGFISCLPV
jgi:hypothetical protein